MRSGAWLWIVAIFVGWVGGLLAQSGAVSSVPAIQAERPCAGVLQDPSALRAVLRGIPRYAKTYVILYTDDLGTSLASPDDPILLSLRVGVPADTPAADLARRYRWPRRVDYPSQPTASGTIVIDVLTRKVDAAVLWAPLAGLWALESDPNHRLNMMPVAEPLPPPLDFSSAPNASGLDPATARCQEAVRSTLEAYGVAPAELLAPPDLGAEGTVPTEPPPENMEEARRGWDVYQANCERCHGPDAISGGLTPDLRERVRRLSYAEFFQTVLQGRVEKGMPAWRGLLKPDDIRLIYQYLRARSFNRLGPGRPSSSALWKTPTGAGRI